MDAATVRYNMADLNKEKFLQATKDAINKYNRHFDKHINELKQCQEDVIRSSLMNDVIGMLLTGYGKSLCYELWPFIMEELGVKPSIVIIVVPLNVIINQQIEKLNGSATCFTKDTLNNFANKESNERQKLLCGHYKYVFSHPEQLVDSKVVRELLLSQPFQNDYETLIVVDEAHCVLEWGPHFRPSFMKLRTVRALVPTAKVMALSATLSTDGQSKVSENLGMLQPKMICLPPARENISIVVSRRPSTITTVQQAVEFVTEPIFKELLSKEQDFPLTVLYFSGSQNWVGLSYEFAMRLMGPKMFQGGTGISHARIVQYHASLEKNNDTVKNTILKNLADDPSRSPLKIVLATVALGMGADLQHVRRVINIGPPKQIEAYVQQMGRAGRNGQQSTAILFFNSSEVGRPEVSKQMKTFCKNEIKCRRQLINQIFGFQRESTVPSNRCCDICNPELSEAYQFSAPDPTKGTLRVALMAFVNQQKTSNTYQKLNASTIQRIVSSSERFTDTQTVKDECDLDQETAHVVSTIIKQIAEFKII